MANGEHHPAKRIRYSPSADHAAIAPSKTEFMMLNPDCLLKLFEYLHLDDLNEIAGVNLMLQSLATYYFRLKHRHFNCLSLFRDAPVSIEQIKKLLSNFGDQIVSLHVSRNIFLQTKHISTDLLLWMKRYCSVNVKTLILEGFEMENRVAKSLTSFFQYIETLTLIDCDFQACIWWTAENLKQLKLKSTTFKWEKLYKAKFKQLEDVQFGDLFSDNASMVRFILSVPMLKRLSIVNCEVTSSVFWAVSELKHLEEFEFHRNERNHSRENFLIDLLHLKKLKQLKVLRLNCEKRSVQRLLNVFIENGVAIEHLELAYGRVDDATAQSISKLTALKTLKLIDMIGLVESHILQMTHDMQLLQELCVKTRAKISGLGIKKIVQRLSGLSFIKIDSPGFMLNAKTYTAMVGIVQKCVKQTGLSITIYSNGGQLEVSDEILQSPENAKWVLVRELDRDNNHIFPHYNTNTDDADDADDSDSDDPDDDEAFSDDEHQHDDD